MFSDFSTLTAGFYLAFCVFLTFSDP